MHRLRTAMYIFCSLAVLTACGGAKPAVRDGGQTNSAAPAPSSPAVPAPPESVRIGPYTQVFATPLPADPAQADVISGFRHAWILWERSTNAWRLVAPVTDYVTGHALINLLAAVAAGKAHHLVPAGTDRLFMTHVTAITRSAATVTTCDDATKFREENPRTGKVDPASISPPDQAYLFVTSNLTRLQGHWALTALSVAVPPDPRADPCQP
jgi:hypothetical protein